MRAKERTGLFVWRGAVTSDPRTVLPESRVGLLITEEVVVILQVPGHDCGVVITMTKVIR